MCAQDWKDLLCLSVFKIRTHHFLISVTNFELDWNGISVVEMQWSIKLPLTGYKL